jgi:hypothetical protein
MADKLWKKPKSKDQIVKVLRKLRDLYVGDFIFRLDRLCPYVISFDGQEPERPVQLLWDTITQDTATWSNQYGCIGKACVAHSEGQPIAMIQAGGVIIPEEARLMVPQDAGLFVCHISKSGQREKVLLAALTIDYFVSTYGIESYGRGAPGEPQLVPSHIIRDKKATWHSVDSASAWRAVFMRMTKRFIPSMDDLKELRHDEDGFRF